jgi:large subunit ribosomal protein L6e
VNQAYVFATSTKIDVNGVQVCALIHSPPWRWTDFFYIDEKIDDSYFSKSRSQSRSTAEAEIFSNGKPKGKEAFLEAKSSHQKSLYKEIIEKIKKTTDLSEYLKDYFGLSKGQFAHQLMF